MYGNQRKDGQFDLETGDWITQISRVIKPEIDYIGCHCCLHNETSRIILSTEGERASLEGVPYTHLHTQTLAEQHCLNFSYGKGD